MATLSVLLTASGLLLARFLSEHSLTQVLLADEPSRQLEARLTYPAVDRYRPRRGPAREASRASLKTLARLEARRGTQALAAAQLIRQQPSQARAVLSRSPSTPDRDNDLAVAALEEGHLSEALELLEHALATHASHPQALWNRGLVLRELQLPLLAAASFDQVAQLGEPGWSAEAREQASRLRQPGLEQQQAWTTASQALLELAQGTRKAVPISLATRFPGITRVEFYKAVRACDRRERVLELLPVAQVLDEYQGDSALQRYVHWAAGRDFHQRAALARGYGLLTTDQHPSPQAFLEQARQSGEVDIYLGALLKLDAVPAHLEEFLRIVQAARDPWLDLMAQRALARHDNLTGQADRGEQRLLTAVAHCDEQRMAYRCLDLINALTAFYVSVYRLSEAQARAVEGLTLARKVEEWELQRVFIQQLSEITRFRSEQALARVYLLESLERDPKQCAFIHQSLASIALKALEVAEARRHIDLALKCHQPLSWLGATLLAQLAPVGLTPDEVERFHQTLSELRRAPQSQGERAYLLFLEGKLELELDRHKGQGLLREAIEAAERLPASDMEARRARSHAYSALIVDAGRAGETAQVLRWVAEARRMPEPGPCSVIVENDTMRLLTVVRSADGSVLPHFDGARNHPLGDGADALTASQLGALSGCESIRVLASASALGRARLLPAALPWSYQLGAGHPARHQPGPLLVVQNVDAPAMLRLPHLPSRVIPEREAGQAPTRVLSGAQASPSRVLAELPRAAEIEIHAHGIFRPELFDAPFIALSPDDDGRYALDMSAIQALRLDKAPVVVLAACGTVRSAAPVVHEPFGLPAAFITAGASVVLAADVDIPDSAGAFFDSVRRRIRSGVAPAVALRDERARWSSVTPQETWVEHVFIFE